MSDALPATVGHNRPPPFDAEQVDALKARIGKAQDAAAKWRGVEIATDDDAATLNDFLGQVHKLDKVVEDSRRAAKKPHEDAGKAVDAAYRPLAAAIEAIAKEVKAVLTKFATAKEAHLRAERERVAAEARAAREAAEAEAAKAAARGDVLAQAEAEEARKRAEAEAAAAARKPFKAHIGTATGAGRTAALRTTWEPEITNIRLALLHFSERAEVRDLIARLAAAEMRAAPVKAEVKIPGVVFHERKAIA